jgi:DNA-binding NarL/FixJ family response regulator
MKILLLDDHEAIQYFVKMQILEILPNAEIILCSKIESAKQIISGRPTVDFAICDLELNAGCNVVIPELCSVNQIPVMVYSSHVNKVLISELNELNVNCYVAKTSGIDALKNGIEALLSHAKYCCPLVISTSKSKDGFKSTEPLFLLKKQKMILEVMAKGYNREETAVMLNLKMTSINNHIARARLNNECENFDELIRRYKFWDH